MTNRHYAAVGTFVVLLTSKWIEIIAKTTKGHAAGWSVCA